MKTRIIYFELDELCVRISFGTYALMMYYGAQIDTEQNKKLFDATLSEWVYRVVYDLPRENYTSSDDTSHFVVKDIQESIHFIDQNIIPALQNESLDSVLDTFGGKEFFEDKGFYENEEYLRALSIGGEEYDDSREVLVIYFKELRDIFQAALDINIPFETYID